MRPLLLFDLDGTLIDSSAGIFASMEHAFSRMGATLPSRERMRAWIGPPLRQTFPLVVGDDPARIEATVEHYRERYDSVGWNEHTVYPGISAAIESLVRSGAQLAVVTTKIETYARRIVEHLPFGAHFSRVYGANANSRHSEKAQMIANALRDFDTRADHAAMIGDRHFDIDGARANDVRGIGVTWGFGSAEELRAAGAQAIAHAPEELPALLAVP
jgi:phosphoglycolate phosphatase